MLTKWIRASRSSPVGMGARRAPPPVVPFRLLYDAHASYVHRRARYAGVPAADVPDVVQRVFEALFKAIDRGLDPSGQLRSWLREVTYRTARDHLKLARNEREVVSAVESLDVGDVAPNPEERMQAIDSQRLVDEVMDMLPAELRIVLAMSDIEEMPMSEIARVLEIPEGTGYSRLRAARRAFATAWRERREGGHASIIPFALWEAHDLLHAAKPIPDMPVEAREAVWRGLVRSLGPGVAGITGAVTGAAAAGAAKSAAVFTAKQAAIGVLASMVIGAVVHALVDRPPPPDTERLAGRGVTSAVVSAPTTAATASPVASVALAVPAAPASTAPTSAAPPASALQAARTAVGAADEKAELAAIRVARDAIQRGELDKASAALDGVKSPRFAGERDELRRLVRAYQDGGR